MATTSIPFIARADYDAFRKLLGDDLPATYPDWLKVYQDATRDCLRRGEVAREIQVQSDEFARFCGARATQCNLANLLRFAIEKSKGSQY